MTRRSDSAMIIDLCNRFIELFEVGEIVAVGQEVRLRPLSSRMRYVRRGNEEDPDFNKEHIEIVAVSE